MEGPGTAPEPDPPTPPQQCLSAFDSDRDEDIDLADFAEFHAAFTGS